MMIRTFGLLAFTFVVTTCIAQSQTTGDNYLLIRLRGNGKAYEYSVDLLNVRATQQASCEDTNACPFYAGADKDPDILAGKKDESLVRSRLAVPYSSRVSLDHTRTLTLIAETDPGRDKYKFEIFKLPSITPERSGTTVRRIADAEWVGTKGCFALLTSSYSVGFMPWHWPAILAGHPPQYNPYYLELYAPDASLIAETIVHEKLKYSGGSLIRRRAFEATTNNALALRAPC